MPKNSSGKALVTAVALLLVASLSISTTFGLMMTKTNSIINTFIPEISSAPLPTPAPLNLTVGGTKILEGRDWQEGDEFSFLLEHKAEDWEPVSSARVSYDEDEEDFDKFTFDLSEIILDEAGAYSFRISEEKGDMEGIIYDKAVHCFDVIVGDEDMDGSLEIQKVKMNESEIAKEDDVYTIDTIFTNNYTTEEIIEPATVTIHIDKTVFNNSGEELSPAGYTFELYRTDTDFVLDGGDPVQISPATTEAGETSITLTYDVDIAEGEVYEYCYVLKESNAGEVIDGMTYDSKEYKLNVFVWLDDDGHLKAHIGDSLGEEYSDSITLSFVNEYKPEETSISLLGRKVLEGRELREDDHFEFKLYQTDADFVIDDSAIQVVPMILMHNTATDKLEGEIYFADIPELTFTEAGKYYFVVKEDVSNQMEGILYDRSEYRITVTVVDNNAQLEADVLIRNEQGKAVDEIVFTNTYRPTGIEYYLQGEKILEGGELKDGMFTFEMYWADENYNIIGQPLKTATNNAKGRFIFEEYYDSEGEYHYVIKESNANPIEGMTYDETMYGVTVTVTDNGNGELSASEYFCIVGGNSVYEIIFTNTYSEAVIPPEEEDKPDDIVPPDTGEETPDDTTEPSKPNDPEKEPPFTGDDRHPGLYAALMCGSMATLLLLVILPKVKKKAE